jgi:hypothetical protein
MNRGIRPFKWRKTLVLWLLIPILYLFTLDYANYVINQQIMNTHFEPYVYGQNSRETP